MNEVVFDGKTLSVTVREGRQLDVIAEAAKERRISTKEYVLSEASLLEEYREELRDLGVEKRYSEGRAGKQRVSAASLQQKARQLREEAARLDAEAEEMMGKAAEEDSAFRSKHGGRLKYLEMVIKNHPLRDASVIEKVDAAL